MEQKEIARAFSNGDFETTFAFLADDVVWKVVGEREFVGKDEVIENCLKTAAYFASVTTKFRTLNVISDKNRVAVNGTAEFIREGQRVGFISACDVYVFDEENRLKSITSYCISEKK
jgi:ketosteroid isomerase-like protein